MSVFSPLDRERATCTGIMPPRSLPKPSATAAVMPPRVNAAGRSQLWIAASVGDVTKVSSLLVTSGGALLVDLQDKNGVAPLLAACVYGHTEVVSALISAGAKVNLQEKDGLSPLYVACQEGHTEVVRALLSRGARVDLLAKDGLSPLHAACHHGHIGVVRALLSAGARADLREIHGMTPLDVLPRVQRAEVERLVQRAKEEGGTRADESRVGAPSAPAAVLPPPHHQSSSLLQPAIGEGPSGGPGGPSAAASSISCRAASERVCSMCGGPPSASASSGGGPAKLKACGRGKSVHYCSQECQAKHWREGGHKEACLKSEEKMKGGRRDGRLSG